MEIWKPIKHYEGLYEVSNYGRVKSLWYSKSKILKPSNNGHGYVEVTLYKNGTKNRYYIHRLVAQTFIPNPHNYPCVNHKNEDKGCNKSWNLEWCTIYYNNIYGTKLKRNLEYAKKVQKRVIRIDKKGSRKIYPSTREAAKEMNPKKVASAITAINHCIKGTTKTAYGYKWSYVERKEI